MIWLTSDTHFGHAKIIEFSRRPFASVEAMDDALIANWNAVVGPRDEVWHLGDFAWWRPGLVATYRARLNGRIHLVLGNHDEDRKQFAEGFESVQDVKYLRWNGHRIFLSHYAHRVWPNSHHGSFHCYGHSHGDLPGAGRSMDVGVDAVGFRPIALDEVVQRLSHHEVSRHHDRKELPQ